MFVSTQCILHFTHTFFTIFREICIDSLSSVFFFKLYLTVGIQLEYKEKFLGAFDYSVCHFFIGFLFKLERFEKWKMLVEVNPIVRSKSIPPVS